MLLTIKKTVQTEVEETIEIELPLYLEYGGIVKVVSIDDSICVNYEDSHTEGIQRWRKNKPMAEYFIKNARKNGRKIDKAAFDNAYQTALSKLNRDMFLEASEPASDEDVREKIEDDAAHQEMEEKMERAEYYSEAKEFEL